MSWVQQIQKEPRESDLSQPATFESPARKFKALASAPPSLSWPTFVWLLIFLVAPLGIVLTYSFLERGAYGSLSWNFNLDNYTRAFDWLYLRIFWDSFKLALGTAVACLVLGYPIAYWMATTSARLRWALMLLVMIPFLTNLVVRTFSIRVLFGEQGPVNDFLISLGFLASRIDWSQTTLSLWFGMVTSYLPFMVLPLYVSIEKFDFKLLEAAKDLGASSIQTFSRVLVPMTKPGILTGLILVFTPALGEFLIPDLLAGARTMLIGNLITEQFVKIRDWPFGAALSVILMIIVVASVAAMYKLEEKDRKEAAGEKKT